MKYDISKLAGELGFDVRDMEKVICEISEGQAFPIWRHGLELHSLWGSSQAFSGP